MHSNFHTLQQHYNTTSTTTQRRQRQYNKHAQLTCIPSSIHLSTSHAEDPFANMSAYVDYQQKIESLKISLTPNTTTKLAATKVTNKNDNAARMTRPLNSTKRRHHYRRTSSMLDMTGDDDGKCWGNGSVISSDSSSSSSSNSGNSSGYLTPPRSLSPMTTATHDDHHYHEQQQPSSDTNRCYVTMEDKVKFLAFLRHRTGWHTASTTVTDLDYMKNGGSLFFWNGQ